MVRAVGLLVLEEEPLELIIGVAEVVFMDTEAMQTIGTILLVDQGVVGPIGWPEEVLGEEPINGVVPSSHPKGTAASLGQEATVPSVASSLKPENPRCRRKGVQLATSPTSSPHPRPTPSEPEKAAATTTTRRGI
ncbi:hypothetical protein ZWY2020_008115 [Hordeum vulgare]|nr:hypothetical protein ZWY2020_008115 [Hordeum vulgare]